MQPFGASRKFYVRHLLAPVNAGIKFRTRKDVRGYNIGHITNFCFGSCLCYALTAYLTWCCLSEGSVNAVCFQKYAAYSISMEGNKISFQHLLNC